jgi:glycine cleavage system H protein
MDTPEQINQDPYKAGWLIKLEISGPEALEGLLSPEAYDALLAK